VINLTEAKAAFGTTISIGGTAIAELTNIGGVDASMDTIDVTSHDSANAYREFIGGLIDAGEVPIEGNCYPGDAGQAALLTALNNRTASTFVITFPTAVGATWTFSALVTGFKAADAPIDGQLPFSASLKITGKPVLAVTASNNLSDLVFTTATLYPAFAAGTYEYTGVSTGASVTVTPTATLGVITVNGNVVPTTEASGAISLGIAGTVTVFTIIVTETNKTPKTYTVRIAKTA